MGSDLKGLQYQVKDFGCMPGETLQAFEQTGDGDAVGSKKPNLCFGKDGGGPEESLIKGLKVGTEVPGGWLRGTSPLPLHLCVGAILPAEGNLGRKIAAGPRRSASLCLLALGCAGALHPCVMGTSADL